MGKRKDKYEKEVFKSFMLGGLGLLTAIGGSYNDVLVSILVEIVNKVFGTQISYTPESTTLTEKVIFIIVGLIIIGLALWFYFKTNNNAKKKTMLQIRHLSIEAGDYSKYDTDLSDYQIEPFSLTQTEEMKVFNESNIRYAIREQEKIVQRIIQRLDANVNGANADMEVSYWGLAHVPLVFLMGYQIADKTNCSFYEWNQHQLQWGKITDKEVDFPEMKLVKNTSKQRATEAKEVVVKIGITYPVTDSDLSGLGLENLNSYYLHLDPPRRNAVISMEQLNQYQKQFRQTLDEINQTYPHLERVHLFYSGQPSLAYRLGSAISPRMDKDIWVYNHLIHANPKYNWALHLKKNGETVDMKITGGIAS